MGWVQNEAKQSTICSCDIYVLPSYFEGLPVSILEAMAMGKPIIATNVGGIPSIVQNGYNGWLFSPGKFNELNKIFDEIFITISPFIIGGTDAITFVQGKGFDKIIKSNVYLKVENTSEKENKIFEVQLSIPGDVIVIKKVSKTFEEGLDAAVHSLERQLKKRKEKLRQFS